MIGRSALATTLVAILAACSASAAEGTGHVAEPPGLWTGPMVSDTPATLEGAEVIGIPALMGLLAQEPLLIDVAPADRKPEGLRPSAIWKPSHRSIPGAVWFPGAGSGNLPPKRVELLLERIAELTSGNKSAPVVTFCRPGCWGSWNLGKRLVQAGYTSVYWFPAGVNGWQEHNDTTAVAPEPGWTQESAGGD